LINNGIRVEAVFCTRCRGEREIEDPDEALLVRVAILKGANSSVCMVVFQAVAAARNFKVSLGYGCTQELA
jgi:hypothetical protein